MLAYIVERMDAAFLASRDNDALVEDVVSHEVTGSAQLVDVADQVPAAEEDIQPLFLEDRLVIEVGRRQDIPRRAWF